MRDAGGEAWRESESQALGASSSAIADPNTRLAALPEQAGNRGLCGSWGLQPNAASKMQVRMGGGPSLTAC